MTLPSIGRRGPGPDERGAALVEFTVLSLLLLVPLAYVVLCAFTVQRAAFAVVAASREAGRAYVTAAAGEDPSARAQAAASLALHDAGLSLAAGSLVVSCAGDCAAPGAHVDVTLDYPIALPVVPRVFGGHPLAAITVHGRHTDIVDRYRSLR